MKTRDNYDFADLKESSGQRRNLRWFVMFLAVISVLLITGCASNAPLDTLDPAGRKSNDINNLINPIFVIAGVVFVIIQGAVLYLGWKFKVREPKEGEESFDGGYPDELFLFPPPQDLQCPICHLTVRDPYMLDCCGATLCQV